jgi:hypothetical protein
LAFWFAVAYVIGFFVTLIFIAWHPDDPRNAWKKQMAEITVRVGAAICL